MKANLFLVAAPRSGSTQLAAWLGTHPDIGMPSIKEPNYFSQHEFPEKYVREHHLSDVDPAAYVKVRSKKQMAFAIFRTHDQYEYLFSTLKEKWRLDASTTYLHCPECAPAIRSYNPDARIILLTRDPIKRALSHYSLAIRTGRTSRSLGDELEDEHNGATPLPGRFILRQSRTKDALENYYSNFPPESRMFVRFEDMIANPQSTLKEIAGFLGIAPEGFDVSVNERNAGDAPRFPWLNSWMMRSGLKTRLRNILPTAVKRRIKRVWFREADGQVRPADLKRLGELLADEY